MVADRTRQRLTWALGAIWLLDAILQFQPYMFTQNFPKGTLQPAGAGSPSWVSGPARWSANLMADHLAVLNTLFALTQLAIAVGILVPRTRKPALIGSLDAFNRRSSSSVVHVRVVRVSKRSERYSDRPVGSDACSDIGD